MYVSEFTHKQEKKGQETKVKVHVTIFSDRAACAAVNVDSLEKKRNKYFGVIGILLGASCFRKGKSK